MGSKRHRAIISTLLLLSAGPACAVTYDFGFYNGSDRVAEGVLAIPDALATSHLVRETDLTGFSFSVAGRTFGIDQLGILFFDPADAEFVPERFYKQIFAVLTGSPIGTTFAVYTLSEVPVTTGSFTLAVYPVLQTDPNMFIAFDRILATPATEVPEPASAALVGAGVLAASALRRRIKARRPLAR